MPTGLQAGGEGEWVRTCREHNMECTVVERRNKRSSPDGVWCPSGGGHLLTLDFMWKVTRRSRPAARGWNGWDAGEGEEA
jgi:hypothetical protein